MVQFWRIFLKIRVVTYDIGRSVDFAKCRVGWSDQFVWPGRTHRIICGYRHLSDADAKKAWTKDSVGHPRRTLSDLEFNNPIHTRGGQSMVEIEVRLRVCDQRDHRASKGSPTNLDLGARVPSQASKS